MIKQLLSLLIIPFILFRVALNRVGRLWKRSSVIVDKYIYKTYYQDIGKEITKVFPCNNYDDGSLAPIILRLAWHCCATYNKYTNTGGSNGSTMRFLPELIVEGNTGLETARLALEPIKQKYLITYSDLWTLAGKMAIESMNGPIISWKSGRIDCKYAKFPISDHLPFGDKDSDHIRKTFTRLGFNDEETVCLLGAHSVGRCHKYISGWEGKWTKNPTKLSNEFYKNLLNEQWHESIVPETGKVQYYNEDNSLMMLPTDIELIRDKNYLKFVKIYSSDDKKFYKDFSGAFSKLLRLGFNE
ncbi:unnamed protein product [Candida verbasci]|uniref:Peroxidase n=1 Tax=Candida verbasci TaxID=1227364 RepID=A0A9W4XMT4_9ASCO|nr:unnamed protein product [Candida verbasci]